MSVKNKVEVQVQKLGPDEKPADSSIIVQSLENVEQDEKKVKPAKIISRADHPIDAKYGSETIRLSPRQTVEVADADKFVCDDKQVIVVLK